MSRNYLALSDVQRRFVAVNSKDFFFRFVYEIGLIFDDDTRKYSLIVDMQSLLFSNQNVLSKMIEVTVLVRTISMFPNTAQLIVALFQWQHYSFNSGKFLNHS